MTVSRSVWFERPLVAELRHEAIGSPGPTQVRIQALFSGISAGTERLVLRGDVPLEARGLMALPSMRGTFEFPISYGYATIGVVDAVGLGVAADLIGQRVFALHPHQDVIITDVTALRPVPTDLPSERLVLAPSVETALNVLWDAGIALGDRVVVVGMGVVGLMIVRLAVRAGAASVAFIERAPERASLAASFGGTGATSADIEAADILIDASGAPAALAMLVDGAGLEARVVAASWYGTKGVPLPLGGRFHPNRVTLRSSQVSHMASCHLSRWTYERRWALVGNLLDDPLLDRLLAPSTPLSEAPAVYSELAAGTLWCPPQRVFDSRR